MTADSRVLTVRQPWADLIMAGVKDVENRSWPIPRTVGCDPCSSSGSLGGKDCPTCAGGERGGGFRLWIHAGRRFDKAGNRAVMDWAMAVSDETRRRGSGPLLSPIKEMLRFQDPSRLGVLLGHVTVPVGCHHAHDCRERVPIYSRLGGAPEEGEDYCSRWADPNVWHWMFTDAVPLLDPIPMKGRQGLWRLPEGVA